MNEDNHANSDIIRRMYFSPAQTTEQPYSLDRQQNIYRELGVERDDFVEQLDRAFTSEGIGLI